MLQKLASRLDSIAQRLFAGMWPMKRRPTPLPLKSNRRPRSFNYAAFQRDQQGLDSSPLEVAVNRISPYRLKCPTMLVVHALDDSVYRHMCKHERPARKAISRTQRVVLRPATMAVDLARLRRLTRKIFGSFSEGHRRRHQSNRPQPLKLA